MGKTLERFFPASIGLPLWLSGGISARIKAVSITHICRATLTSSSSASTDANREAEGWCSIGFWNSQLTTTLYATGNWSRTHKQSKCHPAHLASGVSRRAWIVPEQIDHGERREQL